MAINWPTNPGFPQYLMVGSATGGPEDVTIRTDVAQGPPRTRSRYDNAAERHNGTLFFPTEALYAVFVSFFKTTLKNGTLPFEWKHPDFPSQTVSMKFVGSYEKEKIIDGLFRVRVVLEILPS